MQWWQHIDTACAAGGVWVLKEVSIVPERQRFSARVGRCRALATPASVGTGFWCGTSALLFWRHLPDDRWWRRADCHHWRMGAKRAIQYLTETLAMGW
jgi:hypothetical protein